MDPPCDSPPAPWHLGGSAHLSVWLIPAVDIEGLVASALPPEARLVRVAGCALVAAVFARYEPGGVLSYDEVAVAVLVRRGLGLAATIPAIWVDSDASRTGGRALWGIPKELAHLQRASAPGDVQWRADGDDIRATMRFRPLLALPGVHRLPTVTLLQRLGGADHRARARGLARLALGTAKWSLEAPEALRILDGRRPVLSLALTEFSLTVS